LFKTGRMLKVTIFLIFLGVVHSSPLFGAGIIKPNAQCKLDELVNCGTNTVLKPLNLTFSPIFRQFVKELKSYFHRTGVKGFEAVCKAGADFHTCLGNDWDACTQASAFVQLNISKGDAVAFQVLLYELAYECSPEPYKVITENYKCIQEVHTKYEGLIERCTTRFEEDVKKDPSKICDYANEYVSCLTSPFWATCNEKVASVVCHTAEVGFKIAAPQCAIQCT